MTSVKLLGVGFVDKNCWYTRAQTCRVLLGSAGGFAGGGKDKTGIKGTLLSYSILQYQIFLLVLGNLREMLHLKQFSDSLSC